MNDYSGTAAVGASSWGLLDIILVINIVLKFLGVNPIATWSWITVLWPLWVMLGSSALIIFVLFITWIKYKRSLK